MNEEERKMLGNNEGHNEMPSHLQRMPFFTKMLVMVTTVLCIIGIFASFPENLTNIPYYTLFRFQFYRIFTAVFIHSNFIELLICFGGLIPELLTLEKKIGTIALFLDCILKTLVVQLCYLVLALVLGTLSQRFLFFRSSGL